MVAMRSWFTSPSVCSKSQFLDRKSVKVCFVPCRHGTCNRVTIFMPRPALQRMHAAQRTPLTRTCVAIQPTGLDCLSRKNATRKSHYVPYRKTETYLDYLKQKGLDSALTFSSTEMQIACIATIFVCMVGKGQASL